VKSMKQGYLGEHLDRELPEQRKVMESEGLEEVFSRAVDVLDLDVERIRRGVDFQNR
jgi:hypothetical protein